MLQRRTEIVDETESDDDAVALQMLDDVYRRYHLDAESRLTLHPSTLAHLDHRTDLKFILLLRFEERLELWSIDRRNELLRRAGEILSGLP